MCRLCDDSVHPACNRRVSESRRHLPDGMLLGVQRSNGEEVCLYNFRGSIGAVGNVCTHAEFAMADGTLRNDGTIECVWHGARFDCRTGRVCRGPAEFPLPVFPVRIDGERVLVGARSI